MTSEQTDLEKLKAEHEEVKRLKKELMGLFHYVQRVREEIAAISRPKHEEHHFESMADQLDAIVESTDKASNTIMEATERNQKLLANLRMAVADPKLKKVCDKIDDNNAEIFEACSFQDLTGQRVNKVVKSIKYVEDRVDALIDIWGKDELEKVEVKGDDKSEDEKLLHGPQREGEALDQAAIDALFD